MCLILLILSSCATNEEELRRIEYLRASDQISLRFFEEYERGINSISFFRIGHHEDINNFDTNAFVDFLLSEQYGNYLLNLKQVLNFQAALNLAHGIDFVTQPEARKKSTVRDMVLLRIYAEIFQEKWENNETIIINGKEFAHSSFWIEEVPFLEHRLVAEYENNRVNFLNSLERILTRAISTREERQEVENRLNSRSDSVYRRMVIEPELTWSFGTLEIQTLFDEDIDVIINYIIQNIITDN